VRKRVEDYKLLHLDVNENANTIHREALPNDQFTGRALRPSKEWK